MDTKIVKTNIDIRLIQQSADFVVFKNLYSLISMHKETN